MRENNVFLHFSCVYQKKVVPLRRFLCAMSEQFSFLNEK